MLVADPPWQLNDQLPGPGRGASKHYPTLSLAELCYFPIPRMADDSVLFLWRLASMQEEAMALIRAWGFRLKSEIVWEKTTRTGLPHFGMGRIVRASHETCLIATRGRPAVQDHSTRSRFTATVGRHSEKPEAFYSLVERLYRGPYVELFGRRLRRGWTVSGNDPALRAAF